MSDELPEGWKEVTVGDIADDISYGFTAKSSETIIGPRYLRITDIQNGTVNWASVPFCEVPRERQAAYTLHSGDIVFARTGATTGKSFLITTCPESVFASYLIRVRPSSAVLPELIHAYFQSHAYWQQISENISGSAQPNCNASKLATLTFGLPPIGEQRRIVAKIEVILARVQSSQARLDKIPTLLKRFRQAIFAAASTGRLTADWRKAHPTVGTGADTAQHINEARIATGKMPGRSAKRATTELPRVEVLPESDWPDESIPGTWRWIRFGSAIGELRNGVSPRPNIEPPGVPLLRISAARPGSVDLSDVRFLPTGEEFLAQFALRDGDLLFTRYNGSIELLGVCGMVRGLERRQVLYPDKLMRVRFDHDHILPAYAEVFFRSAAVHERVVANSKSSAGQNGVAGTDIKLQAFALPPEAEQAEIVRRVESLLALAARLQARYETAKTQVDRLTQSVLAKAFRGELVPTEAELARQEGREYESAASMLERIKRERESAGAGTRRARRITRGTTRKRA